MSDMNLSLQHIQTWLPGARLCGDAQQRIQRVHTDSRSVQAGDLFVALQGERFDAHDFLPQVASVGAVAALAHHGLDAAHLAGLEVADTRLALGQLAKGWRAQFTLPVIAVGVGVGVDYALYLLSVQIAMQRRGATLAEAYRKSLDFTGRVVALVG